MICEHPLLLCYVCGQWHRAEYSEYPRAIWICTWCYIEDEQFYGPFGEQMGLLQDWQYTKYEIAKHALLGDV